MILIADSGSTKTDWCLLENAKPPYYFTSKGWNPYYLSSEDMTVEGKGFPITNPKEISQIYFYGSGASTHTNQQIVEKTLKTLFPNAKAITVAHDLLGAAIAAANTNSGVVIILGTGSNACMYDGKKITKEIVNLGFWLGDEGSGAVMGKKLVVDFLYKRMPSHLWDKFNQNYQLDRDKVLEHVYQKPKPNEFFASLVPFVYENKSEVYAQKLIRSEFKAFLKRVEADLGTTQTDFYAVGSIAHFFEEELQSVIAAQGGKLAKTVRKPIEGLQNYYQFIGAT